MFLRYFSLSCTQLGCNSDDTEASYVMCYFLEPTTHLTPQLMGIPLQPQGLRTRRLPIQSNGTQRRASWLMMMNVLPLSRATGPSRY